MTRTLLLSAILALAAPFAAQAACSGHAKQAMSCAEGLTWDSATQSCVAQISS